jgi:hypothetical protein
MKSGNKNGVMGGIERVGGDLTSQEAENQVDFPAALVFESS